MKHRNKQRGIMKVHTFSCYNDTWDKFEDAKHKYDKTADEMLNIMIDNYKLGTLATKRKILIELKNEIQKKLNKL